MQRFKSPTLGERLRELRESRNLMQREIGAVIEVDGAFISKIEKNNKPIDRKHLKKISEFFNIKEKELQTLWLADKIRKLISNEPYANDAIEIVYTDIK